jgi:hypothetical protein
MGCIPSGLAHGECKFSLRHKSRHWTSITNQIPNRKIFLNEDGEYLGMFASGFLFETNAEHGYNSTTTIRKRLLKKEKNGWSKKQDLICPKVERVIGAKSACKVCQPGYYKYIITIHLGEYLVSSKIYVFDVSDEIFLN